MTRVLSDKNILKVKRKMGNQELKQSTEEELTLIKFKKKVLFGPKYMESKC